MTATKLKARPDVAAAEAYDRDFYAWALAQADAFREGRIDALDIANLAEEIGDLAEAVFKELRSHLRVILIHLLKWDNQPERRSRSWAGSIKTHRIDVEYVLDKNPSIRRRGGEALDIAYRQARVRAAVEMKRAETTLPAVCPYTLNHVLDRPIEWPED